MSLESKEKEISTALEKLTITNDLKKNRGNTEKSSLFKPKILCVIDRIKERKNALILTSSMITYQGQKPPTLINIECVFLLSKY